MYQSNTKSTKRNLALPASNKSDTSLMVSAPSAAKLSPHASMPASSHSVVAYNKSQSSQSSSTSASNSPHKTDNLSPRLSSSSINTKPCRNPKKITKSPSPRNKDERPIYHRGVPLGGERWNVTENWDEVYEQMKTAEGIMGISDLYSYASLQKMFPWAKYFRAGMIIIHAESKSEFDMLLVQMPKSEWMVNGEWRMAPERVGFPKGSRIPDEYSSLQTALRETREEIGVDLNDPIHNAKISYPVVICLRPEYHILELTICFIAYVNSKPVINIDMHEICGYKWVAAEEVYSAGKMTDTTRAIVDGFYDLVYEDRIVKTDICPDGKRIISDV